ncbi:transporter substrate-binding domain-containing protein [Microbacterium sp. A588]
MSVPTDPAGTLDAVTDGTLRVGVSQDDGLVQTSSAKPSGPLIDLVDAFAESLDADVQFTASSEETLVVMMEKGELDLIVGGLTDKTPWSDRVGVTRGYPGIDGADGRSIVMFVPLGENAFLTELEGFLDTEVGS